MKRTLFLSIFICLCSVSYNQVIKGTVFDQKTREKIYSASIYFNGTFNGKLSDQDGNFEIDISKNISMPLTISALGYFSTTITDYSPNKPLLVYLTPKLFELNEVVVNAKSHTRERKVNLTIFRNEFIGTTGNAFNCEIINENDLKFIYDSKDTVKAYALKPIEIENKALGYKITYYLDKFEYIKASSLFFFKGNIIFNEDLTTDDAKKQLFERKRKSAYLGSRMHFFRALWVDDLNNAGFTVKNNANETLGYKKIVVQDGPNKKSIKYKGDLGICYYSKNPTSYIVFQKERVFFDKNGYFDPAGISWEGSMAQQRIADWLPFEYTVKE